MACGCCDLNRIKKLFEEKRKKEAEAAKEEKEVLKEVETKPIAKPRKKKVEVKEVTEVSEEL